MSCYCDILLFLFFHSISFFIEHKLYFIFLEVKRNINYKTIVFIPSTFGGGGGGLGFLGLGRGVGSETKVAFIICYIFLLHFLLQGFLLF